VTPFGVTMIAFGYDIWLIEPAKSPALDLLSSDERTSALRFVREADRDSFLSTRLALRCLLAEATNLHPRELRFTYNDWGKPQLEHESCCASLDFSVSHTDGLAVIALSRHGRIGVDVEREREVLDCTKIAAGVFCEAVVERLARFPRAEQDAAFLRLWTAGEALVKAAGTGLAGYGKPVPLALSSDGEAEVYLEASFGDGDWTLIPVDMPPGFVGSTAIEGSCSSQSARCVPKRIELAQLTSRYVQ
jgi:4'-phosphopantetheinyl transferase